MKGTEQRRIQHRIEANVDRVQALALVLGFTSMDSTNQEWKILQKILENSKLQNLNLLHARNYLHDIYIVFTTTCIAFTLY